METQYAGIDPGIHGAIAIVNGAGHLLEIITMPLVPGLKGHNAYDLAEAARIAWQKLRTTRLVTVERQQPMPAVERDRKTKKILRVLQGGNAIFTTGFGYAIWLAMLQALSIPFTIVTARNWQKEFFTPQRGKSKAQAFQTAQRLWPQYQFKLSRSGEYDAALIAEWARRHAGLPDKESL